mgnify:CR=1 FL=1
MTLKLIVGLCDEHHKMLKAIMPSGSLREWGEHEHGYCDFDCEEKNQCSAKPTHFHMLRMTPNDLIPVQPGSVTSEAKAEAARLNGTKGGRPIIQAWRPWCENHKPEGAVKLGTVTVEEQNEMICAKRACKNRCEYSF